MAVQNKPRPWLRGIKSRGNNYNNYRSNSEAKLQSIQGRGKKPKKSEDLYVVVVTCVVIEGRQARDRRVLIMKRSSKESEGPGLWTIPGGRIERSDWIKLKMPNSRRKYFEGAFERACRRELREETGLTAKRFHILSGQETMFIRSSGLPTVVLTYWTHKVRWPKAHLRKKPNLYRWIKADEVEKYNLIGDVKNRIYAALAVINSS